MDALSLVCPWVGQCAIFCLVGVRVSESRERIIEWRQRYQTSWWVSWNELKSIKWRQRPLASWCESWNEWKSMKMTTAPPGELVWKLMIKWKHRQRLCGWVANSRVREFCVDFSVDAHNVSWTCFILFLLKKKSRSQFFLRISSYFSCVLLIQLSNDHMFGNISTVINCFYHFKTR